jgi:hypothetical protein
MESAIGLIRHVLYEFSLTHCVHHPMDLTGSDGSMPAGRGPGGMRHLTAKIALWMPRPVSVQPG